jgi:hypothetical protein
MMHYDPESESAVLRLEIERLNYIIIGLRALLESADMEKGGDPSADLDWLDRRPGLRPRRSGSVLVQEGRVPADPMSSPLNPERDPAPFALLREGRRKDS